MTTIPSPILQKEMAGFNSLVKVADQTSHGTANMRKAITHGFTDHMGNAATPEIAIPVVQGADNDSADVTDEVIVVKMDSTTVTVKSAGTSVPFDLYVG